MMEMQMNLINKTCVQCGASAQVEHPKGPFCIEHWARHVDQEYKEYQELKERYGIKETPDELSAISK